MHSPIISTHPSVRWRRRSSTSNSPPPRRCSSAVSISSIDSSLTVTDYNDTQINETNKDVSGGTCWNFLRVDSLNLQSTSWRNERMLASRRPKSLDEDEEPTPISSIPHFGHNICFSPKFHYTALELEPYRQIGDPEMDELLQYLSEKKNTDSGDSCGCGAFDDVIAYAAMAYEDGEVSPPAQLYKHYYEEIPAWVDFDQIQRGIDVFLAYLPAAGSSLFYRSLVGGFSIPQITKVLIATRYLVPSHLATGNKSLTSTKTVERNQKRSEERLFDTGGFLACCFAPLASTESDSNIVPTAASLRPGGKGWMASLRVRVLHAKVRRSLLRSKKTDSDGKSFPIWDIESNGIPINQEDMAATLLAFSVNVLIGIEIISGRPLHESEQRDYLALWRYLGWLLGVDTVEEEWGCLRSSNARKCNPLTPLDPCGPRKLNRVDNQGGLDAISELESSYIDPTKDSIIHSHASLESMILHLLHPNQNSREVVSHLLGIRNRTEIRSEICRKLLGDPLSDELHISKSSFKWKGFRKESLVNFWSHVSIIFFVYFYLLLLRVYTLLSMKYPWIRSRALNWHASLDNKYLLFWEKGHAKRMTKVASDRKGEGIVEPSSKSSFCPFSMVMDPNSV